MEPPKDPKKPLIFLNIYYHYLDRLVKMNGSKKIYCIWC
jgi:hypothetical protein